LMQALVEQERLEIGEDKDRPGAGFELPFQAYEIIQMIDHTLEAAISNEKLVLRRLRDFEEREEARIRYWVQRDQPATQGS
jgi:nicotinamide mononucleotide adenylyltransferase